MNMTSGDIKLQYELRLSLSKVFKEYRKIFPTEIKVATSKDAYDWSVSSNRAFSMTAHGKEKQL